MILINQDLRKIMIMAADNIVFAKGGVEDIIEKPDAFSRKLLFILHFFVIW